MLTTSVNHEKNDGELLYNFYYTTFDSFNKHSDFAKFLMKEQIAIIQRRAFHENSELQQIY